MFELWGCEENHLLRYLSAINNPAVQDDAELKSFFLSFEKGEPEGILNIDGSEASIKISGILSQDGPPFFARLLGIKGTSYSEIISALNEIGASDEIKTVRLIMDTPGGDVKGVDNVWTVVKEVASNKTVIAENHGLIASAGYWIASAASRITAVSPIVETGSIGVVAVQIDDSKALEERGYKRIKVVSQNAPNKQPDGTTQKGLAVIQERVDSIERVFIQRIAEGRGTKESIIEKSFGKGALLIAQDPGNGKNDALSVGMIDAVEGTISKATSSDEETSSQTNIDTTPKKIEKGNKSNPAGAGSTLGEEKKMKTLQELMSENPALASEVNNRVKEAVAKAKAEIANTTATAIAFLESEEYPKPIRAMACKVLKGESAPAALEGAATAYDAMKAEQTTEDATEETTEQGETRAEANSKQARADGVIETEDDYQATVTELRSALNGEEDK